MPPRAKPHDERSAGPSTPERLIQAAEAAFAAHGFEGASTRTIAAAAGVPQGLVRHHFGSKRGLWLAVLERGLQALRQDLLAREPLSVADLVELAPRNALLLRVVLHGVLDPAPERAQLLAGLQPLWEQLRSMHHHARGAAATELELSMWLGALLARPLIGSAIDPADALASVDQRVQRETLTSWLLDVRVPAAAGPWSLAAARERLRGG